MNNTNDIKCEGYLAWQEAWEKYKEEHDDPDWYAFADEFFGIDENEIGYEEIDDPEFEIGKDFDGDIDDDGIAIPEEYGIVIKSDDF